MLHQHSKFCLTQVEVVCALVFRPCHAAILEQ